MFRFKYLFVVLVLIVRIGTSSKILAVFPCPGFSQYILAEPLLIALAEKGHNVTVISAFETKNVKNLRNILVDTSRKTVNSSEILFHRQELSIYTNIMFVNKFGLYISEKTLADPKVQSLLQSDEKFDLVLVETFLNEALLAFAKHFDAHQVLFHSMGLNEWNSHLIGNPNIPSYLPITYGGYTNQMTFRQRFRNTLALWFSCLYKKFVHYPAQQKLVDRYFPRHYSLNDFMYNSSIMLTCSHVSTAEALPLTTSVVEVGGLHITDKKLPVEIQEFLDSSNNGAIFFSTGSNVNSSRLPKNVIQEIVSVIGKLKQKVLWKFEEDELENKPDNLMISKWFPQNDILAHPNIVLFISHCGMGSITEAIYHGVPVVGIPIFADQLMNARRLVLFGMGLEVSLKRLSGEILNNSIHEILTDPKYKENAKRRSNIMRDQPMKPLDLAVYWIEYVLRQNGAHHIKNSILELAWYQLYLLDVIGVLLAVLLAVLYCIFIGLRLLRRYFFIKEKTD